MLKPNFNLKEGVVEPITLIPKYICQFQFTDYNLKNDFVCYHKEQVYKLLQNIHCSVNIYILENNIKIVHSLQGLEEIENSTQQQEE